MKSAKDRITGIISIIIVLIAIFAYFVSGVVGLVRLSGLLPLETVEGNFSVLNKGKYVQKDFDCMYGPVMYVSHTVNGIPVGKEQYYCAYDNAGGAYYYVRAPKFLSGLGKVNTETPINIKGKIRTADAEARRLMIEIDEEFANEGYYVPGFEGDHYYLDNSLVTQSILRIVSTILMIGGILPICLSPVSKKPVNTFSGLDKLFLFGSIFIALAGLALCGYTITFLF